MKKKLLFSAIGLFTIGATFAQTSIDALRYSQTGYMGSARATAMGGSFGALGAEISAIGINPAGLSLYRRSEISISPAVFLRKNATSFFGNTSNDTKYNFNLGELGLVIATKPVNADKHGWQSINLSIAYNKLANFSSVSSYSGFNASNSLLDYFIQSTNAGNGTQPSNLDPFTANLAYQSFLINPIDSADTTHYYSEIKNGGVLQRRNVNANGSIGECLASMAGNYKDKLYIGASVGYQILSFSETSSYKESDQNDSLSNFNSFVYDQQLTTEGSGVYLRFGMLFKPVEWIKVGGSIQTPTIFTMSDTYSSNIKSDLDSGGAYDFSAEGAYKYELTTPLRSTASIGFLIGKLGCFNIDYENVNYSESRFSSASNAFFDTNNDINNTYRSASTLRMGGEYRWDNLSFRGGYFMSESPFKQGKAQSGYDFSSIGYSAGIGIRDDNYFLDFAFTNRSTTEYYRNYSLINEEVEGAKTKSNTQHFMMTLGYKF